jgi:urea carboxylase
MASPASKVPKLGDQVVLVANRGEIAVRVFRTAKALGYKTVAVYTEKDLSSSHIGTADVSHEIPSYLDMDAIIAVCKKEGVTLIHPGYGFVSENEKFPKLCAENNIAFCGPRSDSMKDFGYKSNARDVCVKVGVPVVPGTPLLESLDAAIEAADRIGYPVMLKAAAGGGGIGIVACFSKDEMIAKYEVTVALAKNNFGDGSVYLEKMIQAGHHIEVQVFGDGYGKGVAVGPERECSLQRRNQKVVEEAPSPLIEVWNNKDSPAQKDLPAEGTDGFSLANLNKFDGLALREKMLRTSVKLVETLKYRSAGTLEYIVDGVTGEYYFLEMNTRLQVEHPVTEQVTGMDLVKWMLDLGAADRELGADATASNWSFPDFECVYAKDGEPKIAVPFKGASIEVRAYCEDPVRNFMPTPGTLEEVTWPKDAIVNGDCILDPAIRSKGECVRVDTWVQTGSVVTSHFDPMVAKIIVYSSESRAKATTLLARVLQDTRIAGTVVNIRYLRFCGQQLYMKYGDYDIGTLTRQLNHTSSMPNEQFTVPFGQAGMTIVNPGVYTTVQDYPGRVKERAIVDCWRIGIPPSGPMDPLALRAGNRILRNTETAAGLEVTVRGPTIYFNEPTTICITGAAMPDAVLEKEDKTKAKVTSWTPIEIARGTTLKCGLLKGGQRAYLTFLNGIDVPLFLGSRATLPLGKMGGHQGRPLIPGDNLMLFSNDPAMMAKMEVRSKVTAPVPSASAVQAWYEGTTTTTVAEAHAKKVDKVGADWCIGVCSGPNFSPDFLTTPDGEMFFGTDYETHYNSNRLGIRFIGPRFQWARTDGGAGGAHPSNVIEVEYAVGTINVTGDMPIAITVDGPSLGGFVCCVTVVEAEMWKLGQLRPGDKVRFCNLEMSEACSLKTAMLDALDALGPRFMEEGETVASRVVEQPLKVKPLPTDLSTVGFSKPAEVKDNAGAVMPDSAAIFHRMPGVPEKEIPPVTVRVAGDRYILYEYGTPNDELDFDRRFRIHAFETKLLSLNVPGINETAPGVASLQIRYDNCKLTLYELVDICVNKVEPTLPDTESLEVETRVLHMPIAVHDHWMLEALQTYIKSVRSEAPYLPDTLEFVARNNGLDGIPAAEKIILDASYMVMGLGDVYLGCPAALPVDPRHRIVNPKFNPARTFTSEGAVGIGGAFMCLYPTPSPGGYQLVGRSLPIWNSYCINKDFTAGTPWLLQMFDQVRFYKVTDDELEAMYEKYRNGLWQLKMEKEMFSLKEYKKKYWSDEKIVAETMEFRKKQNAAAAIELKAERAYHAKKDAELAELKAKGMSAAPAAAADEIPDTHEAVYADVSANVWKVLLKPGDAVKENDTILILECMKMELSVVAPCDGTVRLVTVAEHGTVTPGKLLATVEGK